MKIIEKENNKKKNKENYRNYKKIFMKQERKYIK